MARTCKLVAAKRMAASQDYMMATPFGINPGRKARRPGTGHAEKRGWLAANPGRDIHRPCNHGYGPTDPAQGASSAGSASSCMPSSALPGPAS